MSGPNILTATWKGIDAFSIITQPYNHPFLKLPPWQPASSFFVPPKDKNNLLKSRGKMLENMRRWGAWRGWNVVKGLTLPHYDSRPRFESFPQSAETYLCATDERGIFHQMKPSLLVGMTDDEEDNISSNNNNREEPIDIRKLRDETNQKQLPCYPIANGHCIVLPYQGSLKITTPDTLSPKEESKGTLKWDTYMPNVKDENWDQYKSGRKEFMVGCFTNDDNTMAGDRSTLTEYNGARIISRLYGLGLLNPRDNLGGEEGRKGEGGGLFQS